VSGRITVVARMKARQSVTLLALGDSITWGTSVRWKRQRLPGTPRGMLRKHYGYDRITVVSAAIGGSTPRRAGSGSTGTCAHRG